jgi:phosphopantetheine adenylyltransferase
LPIKSLDDGGEDWDEFSSLFLAQPENIMNITSTAVKNVLEMEECD